MGITDGVHRGEVTVLSWGVWLVTLIFGGVIGFLTAMLAVMTGSNAIVPVFFGTGIIVVWYLHRQPIPSAALAKGLYFLAGVAVLMPVAMYVPTILAADTASAGSAGEFVGSLIGLVVFGVTFFLGAVFLLIVGYLVDRRARRKLEAAS